MSMEQTDVRLKLLIDSKAQRVLYGEADNNFIDFLFNLLSLPLGAVIRLLKNEAMIGCLGNLYDSIETFNEAYLQPNQSKDRVLKPEVSFNCSISTKLLPYASADPDPCTTTTIPPPIFPLFDASRFNITTPLFGAPSAPSTATSAFSNDTGPFGTRSATSEFSFGGIPRSNNTSIFGTNVQPASTRSRESSLCGRSESPTTTYGEKVGFVKGLSTYIVMDDLTVKPISEFSILTLLKEFNVKDVNSLEEKVITLDVNEGVRLLEASLQSKTVLTNVFLKRRRSQVDNDVRLGDGVKPSI